MSTGFPFQLPILNSHQHYLFHYCKKVTIKPIEYLSVDWFIIKKLAISGTQKAKHPMIVSAFLLNPYVVTFLLLS